MANTHETLTALFTATAEKIRKKTATTDAVIADNFPAAIETILTPADGSIPTQAGKTVTPSANEQTAVDSGVYTSGAVKVAGDANLKPENIVQDKSIFGINGNAEPAAALDTDMNAQDSLIVQIAAALEGKVTPSGASIDTCSITISGYALGSDNVGYIANCFVDGKIVIKSGAAMTEPSTTITDVICGSMFCACCHNLFGIEASENIDDEQIEMYIPEKLIDIGEGIGYSMAFTAPVEAGAHGTIEFYED